MRAAVGDGRGGLRVAEVPRPRPGPGELLLCLRCAGLCGTDLWKLRQGLAPPGSVLGHEVVGTVVELGERTRNGPDLATPATGAAGTMAARQAGLRPETPAIGDRAVVVHHVACGACRFCRAGSATQCAAFREQQLVPGGFSELLVVREPAVREGLFLLPPLMEDETALFLEPLACVLRGLARGGFGDAPAGGDRPVVAILGAGGMGLLHLLALRAAAGPAPFIVLAEPLAERRALALRLGADNATEPGAAVRAEILERSDGRGADLVFDTVGGAAPLADALALGRPGGTVVLFAHAPAAVSAAGEAAGFALNAFFKSERRLIATYSSSRSEQNAAWQLLTSGRLDPRPLITHRLPLERAGEAVALAASGTALKILLTPGGGCPAGLAGSAGTAAPPGGGI
jgi:L-iditol 2-dehydrogenase